MTHVSIYTKLQDKHIPPASCYYSVAKKPGQAYLRNEKSYPKCPKLEVGARWAPRLLLAKYFLTSIFRMRFLDECQIVKLHNGKVAPVYSPPTLIVSDLFMLQ